MDKKSCQQQQEHNASWSGKSMFMHLAHLESQTGPGALTDFGVKKYNSQAVDLNLNFHLEPT